MRPARSIPKVYVNWLIAVFLLWLGATKSHALEYPEKMIFRNIIAEQDIGVGEVEAIIQDVDGFMWFGGRNSLLRFDAYDFLQIKIESDPNDESKPTDVSQVVDLFVDSQNQLWVATRWGLYQYDRDREVLRRLKAQSGVSVNFDRDVFNRVVELHNGTVLVSSYEGLFEINPKTWNVNQIRATGGNDGPITNRIHDMFVDRLGQVWMGSDGGASRYDPVSRQFKHYIPYSENPAAPKENSVQTIKADKNGQVWAGASNGLYRINPETGEIFRYKHDSNDPFSISDDIHEDIFLDSQGILWIGTDRGGLNYYHYETDSFRSFKHVEGQNGSLSSSITRRIYEDRNHDLWIGTYPSGINFYDRSSSAITVYKHESNNPRSMAVDLVTNIQEDARGNLWIATDGGGPHYFDRQQGIFKNYLATDTGPARVASKKMLCGLVDSGGDVWFGTWDAGVFLYNAELDRFDQLPLDTSQAGGGSVKKVLTDTSIWHIYEDRQHNIWFATHNVGLVRYDKSTGDFFYYSETGDPKTSISKNLVWTVYEDSKGRFWAGTVGGLNIMDREKGTFKSFIANSSEKGSLNNDFITSIFSDDQARVWIGTNNGLHLFNEADQTFTLFTSESHGFVDDGIRTIEQDQNHNLWLGTNNGIVVFNPDTQEVKNYRRFAGEKIGGISTGGSHNTSRGEIVMGGPNGLRIYNVNKLKENTTPPPVALTEFRIFTKLIPINDPGGFLSKAVNLSEKITLSHRESMISFGFAALNFRDADKNQYAYKLEGFDNDWREVGGNRQAMYTNLNAGQYHFRVRASNNDGVWNEQGAGIKIHQLPPPWLTWWAKILYALAVIAILVRFVQLQRKKRKAVEEQNRILEMRVAERTAELQVKNDDIQSMLSNMRQGLFTIDSDGTVHPEYSLHLECIFERKKLAGLPAFELLFTDAQMGSNELNQVKEGMFAIIGEDEMNFEFNSHVLVNEYATRVNGALKNLSLDWNPIVDRDGIVKKLMVSVRDVTLLKQMEREAASKKRELDIISQLLNLPSAKYRKFIESSQEFLQKNSALISGTDTKKPEVISALFRNMHTVKGNCRTFGFTHFSDVVHEVESRYSELSKNDEQAWNQQVLLEDIERINAVMQEYEHVYFKVLGRSNTASQRSNKGFWLNEDAIERFNRNIDQVMRDIPALSERNPLAEMRAILQKGMSLGIEEAIKDVLASLPSIAEQLDKKEPVIDIRDCDVRIRKEYQDTMSNVFSHILRNSLDHGIETADERIEAGKPEKGTIIIAAQITEDAVSLGIEDDGRGLNIKRLYEIGTSLKRWLPGEKVKVNDLCEMIFHSGISTKDTVSDISGRGVGMDAVREFIRELGGDVTAELVNGDKQALEDGQTLYAPVKFVVSLPRNMYVRV